LASILESLLPYTAEQQHLRSSSNSIDLANEEISVGDKQLFNNTHMPEVGEEGENESTTHTCQLLCTTEFGAAELLSLQLFFYFIECKFNPRYKLP
jgi:hypothetical protein